MFIIFLVNMQRFSKAIGQFSFKIASKFMPSVSIQMFKFIKTTGPHGGNLRAERFVCPVETLGATPFTSNKRAI